MDKDEREALYFRVKMTLANLSHIAYMREVKVFPGFICGETAIQEVILEECMRIIGERALRKALAWNGKVGNRVIKKLELGK